jgi:hypothetical protein
LEGSPDPVQTLAINCDSTVSDLDATRVPFSSGLVNRQKLPVFRATENDLSLVAVALLYF